MKPLLIVLFLLIVGPAFPQIPTPKFFVETTPDVNHRWLESPDEVKATMIKQYKVPAEWFTEKRAKADYILRIVSEGANCRCTVLYNDRIADDEIVLASKRIIY